MVPGDVRVTRPNDFLAEGGPDANNIHSVHYGVRTENVRGIDHTAVRTVRLICSVLGLRTKVAAASAWLPLLYDTAIVTLTTYKAHQTLSFSGYFHSPILQTVLAEGMVYYRRVSSVSNRRVLTPEPSFSPLHHLCNTAVARTV